MQIPNNLETTILARIEDIRQKSAQRKLLVETSSMGMLSAISLASIIFALKNFLASAVQSGLDQYLSLIFSDIGSIGAIWKEFSFTLAESVPIISTLALLGAAALFLWSSVAASQGIIGIRRHKYI